MSNENTAPEGARNDDEGPEGIRSGDTPAEGADETAAPQGTGDATAAEGADDDETSEDTLPADSRPLGYWLRSVDDLITRALAQAFADEGASRRDWMLLNVLSDAVDVPGLADKLARRGRRLSEFVGRGWVVETGSGWELTDEGREARESLAGIVQGVRERVASAVSPEDFAAMRASLEAIARELGWSEDARAPWGRGYGRGYGRGHGWGARPEAGSSADTDSGQGSFFGPGFGFPPGLDFDPRSFARGLGRFFGFEPEGSADTGSKAESGDPDRAGSTGKPRPGSGPGYGPGRGYGRGFGPWFGPEFDPRRGGGGWSGHHDHPGHGHGHKRHDGKAERRAERAYERGFAAGFDAARRGQQQTPEASDPGI